QELGSDQDFDALAADLKARGLGLILDFVPNHMGLDASANRWWRDVLQHGQASSYADFFDIDWDPITPELKGRILLPILQDGYGEVLERAELRLVFENGELQLQYFDRRLPIEPTSAVQVLRSALTAIEPESADRPDTARDSRQFSQILDSLEHLPPASTRDPDQQRRRHEVTENARQRLATLASDS